MTKKHGDQQGERINNLIDAICAGAGCIGWAIAIVFFVKVIWP